MRGSRKVHYLYEDETEDVPRNVTHVDVEPSIEDVPMRAFQQRQNLVDVSLNEVKRLEKQAFQQCVSLKKVELSPPTMKIGIRCFDGCHKLVVADLSECSVWVLMTQCFRNCSSLEIVHMPRTLEVIARDAFRGCQNLTEVSLEHTKLRVFGKRALSNCKSLQKVRIPHSTEQVGCRAFAGCTSLTEVEVPNSLHFNREDVFKNCLKLGKITYLVQQRSIVNRRLPVPTLATSNVQAVADDAAERPTVPAREQVSTFAQALDEAKQENTVLSQRLTDVCTKLERYESQWSTVVDQLKCATMTNSCSHQSEQERALQAKEVELEKYKNIVEQQNEAIRMMKLNFLGLEFSEERSSSEDQVRACLEHTRANVTRVPIRAALGPDMSLADFVEMRREQPMESSRQSNAYAECDLGLVEQSQEGEIRGPVPFIVDEDSLIIDTADLLVSTSQLSQGSDEWQVM